MTRKVVITGAAGGIGRSIAERFIADGDTVVAIDCDRTQLDALVTELGSDRIRAVACDLGNEQERAALADQLRGTAILVNNAAAYDDTGAVVADLELARHLLEVNFLAPIHLASMSVGAMQEAGWGRILNVSSVLARRASPEKSVYAASKSALESWTRSASKELGPFGITVNAVAPGAIPTRAEGTGIDESSILDRQHVKTRGTSSTVAGVVHYLASNDGYFITGHTVPVDGGWEL